MSTRRPPRKSGLATLALASTAVFCLPLGVIFGALALVRIGRSEGRLTGTRTAVVAIALSLLANVATYGFMTRVYPPLLSASACATQQLMLTRTFIRIHRMENEFRIRSKRFGSLDEVGFKPIDGDPYSYQTLRADTRGFTVRAIAVNHADLEGDTWEFTEQGVPRNTVAGCTR